MFILQRVSTHEVTDHDPPLPAVLVVLEPDDDHPMALQTPSPPVVSVLLADFARRDELQVAVCADVVVAVVAVGTVEA